MPTAEQAKLDSSRVKIERIAFVENLMVSNAWRRGITGIELSERWGCSLKAVEAYASEASRRIAVDFNPEERRKRKAEWLANIDSAQRTCRERGDMNALKGLIELEGRALGHFEPEKVQVSGNLGDLLQLGLTGSSQRASEEVG